MLATVLTSQGASLMKRASLGVSLIGKPRGVTPRGEVKIGYVSLMLCSLDIQCTLTLIRLTSGTLARFGGWWPPPPH